METCEFLQLLLPDNSLFFGFLKLLLRPVQGLALWPGLDHKMASLVSRKLYVVLFFWGRPTLSYSLACAPKQQRPRKDL